MDSHIVMLEKPQLTAPYIILGMNGWLNAGEVSTGSIDYLRHKINARKFAYIDAQNFYIYQIPSSNPEKTMRPHTQISEGMVKTLDFKMNDLFSWKSGLDHDLIIFSGAEPNLRWPEYCQIILDLTRQFQAPRIYCLGAFFDQVPHSRETRINVTVSHQRMKSEFESFAHFGDYSGPCSFTTMLTVLGREQGIEVAGMAARVPIYISDLNIKTCYDLLKNVLKMTGFQIDLGDLRQAGEKQVETLDRAFSENSTALEQLKKLEELYDSVSGKELLQDPGDNYDELLEEMRRLKRNGRKPH